MTPAAARRALLADREQLLCRLHGFAPPELDGHGDDADRTSARERRTLAGADIERIEQRILEIAAALERIRAGVYGVCVDCTLIIPSRRLENDLAIARCVSCQQVAERRAARSAAWTEPPEDEE